MPSPEHRFSWHGRSVAWDSFGEGPPLVFCHGTPWSSNLWRPIADTFGASHTVYLWDMPGYGRSSKDEAHDVDLGTQGEVFAALLEEWRLERPHVIAHDFGGAVSLRALLLHDRRFESLCLVDVVALRPWGSPFFRLVHAHPDVFSALPGALHEGLVERYVMNAARRTLAAADLAMLVEPWQSSEGQAAFYRQIAQADESFTAELEPLLTSISLPVHVVWGQDDFVIPADQASRLRDAIPGATLELIPEAGHLIQLDAPAALTATLHRWLDSQA
jgi:pimeloyl-ACP methyl ester carboxylesterase